MGSKTSKIISSLTIGTIPLILACQQNKDEMFVSDAFNVGGPNDSLVIRSPTVSDKGVIHGTTLIEIFRKTNGFTDEAVTFHATDGAHGQDKDNVITSAEVNFAQYNGVDLGLNTTSFVYLFRNDDGTFRVQSGTDTDYDEHIAHPDAQIESLGANPEIKKFCPNLP